MINILKITELILLSNIWVKAKILLLGNEIQKTIIDQTKL